MDSIVVVMHSRLPRRFFEAFCLISMSSTFRPFFFFSSSHAKHNLGALGKPSAIASGWGTCNRNINIKVSQLGRSGISQASKEVVR